MEGKEDKEQKDKEQKDKGDSEGRGFSILILMLSFCVLGVFLYCTVLQSPVPAIDEEEGIKDKKVKVEATILDTEAIGGSALIDYNTYFKTKDGEILKIEDDDVYTYAKFNKGNKVELEITKGAIETFKRDEYGNILYEEPEKSTNKEDKTVMKKQVYVDNYEYISDVLVGGKSLKN